MSDLDNNIAGIVDFLETNTDAEGGFSPPIDSAPFVQQAINEIFATYGDIVSVDAKKKSLLKFGRNEAVGTNAGRYTIMTLPGTERHETYVNDNLITHVSSDDAGDTEELAVEGHTLSGGELTFVTQMVTLAGLTKTALTTPIARISRGANNGSTDLVGNIYFYEDDTVTAGEPDTDTKVHMMIPAGENQTFKASTSISSSDYLIIVRSKAGVLKKAAAFVNARAESRVVGKVFRPFDSFPAGSPGAPTEITFEPYKIIPSNSDVRLVADANSSGTDVSGSIHGFLATVIG